MNRFFIAVFFCVLFTSVHEASAQPPEVKFHFGTAAFLDESTPFDHTVFGVSVKLYLTDRIAVEPEFAYMQGPGSDRDYLIFPNLSYDVKTWNTGKIYAIGGAGLLHNRRKFPGSLDPNFSSNAWTLTAGLGGNIFVSEDVFVSGDFRMGLEPLYRISGGIGYRFGED